MVEIKAFLLAAVFAIVCKADDPYANIGPCRDDILDQRYKGFKIEYIANSGNYDYVYLNKNPQLKCASATIYGDEVIGYRGSSRITENRSGVNKVAYYLNVIDDGVLNETFVGRDANGQSVVNNYNLIVLDYEPVDGVFYYVRCSNEGKSVTDSRSIVVRSCHSYTNSRARKVAASWFREDHLKGFQGEPLRPVQICK